MRAPNLGDGYESPQAITDGSGAEIASFVYAGEQPLMRIENGAPVYYLQDTMGSVIGTADDAGSVVNTLDYDGFGLARGAEAESASTLGEFGFQGMWRDPSGLYYVRARTYEPETGRFTSRDPARGSVWSTATLYPYAFGNHAPFVFRDPTGAFSILEMSTVTTVTGILGAISFTAGVGGTLNRERHRENISPEDTPRRFEDCVRENRLVDDDFLFDMVPDENSLLPVNLSQYTDPLATDGGLLQETASAEAFAWGYTGKKGGGFATRTALQVLGSLTGVQQGLGPGITNKAGAIAYYIRQTIVQTAATHGGVARLTVVAAGRAELFASALSRALTPLFVSWGAHDAGAVSTCLARSLTGDTP